jgi:RNA polymerase sigma-70 factor (ECF subfamily)
MYVNDAKMTLHTNVSDEELVNSAKQGDLDAFTSLYRRYFNVVYKRVSYVIPEADVEDVTQEIFIALLRSINGFQARALFRTWFRTLTTRQIAEYYRNRSRKAGNSVNLDEIENFADHHSRENLESRILVRKALSELPEQYREIILMRFAESLSFNEIASLLNRHPEGTKSLFRRAVSALTQKLEEKDVHETI